jgi:ketosteroid isomerase-like protein
MSQENVEAVRRAYQHFNRTHAPAYELFDPNVEWHTAADLPDTGTHRGHSGVAGLFSAWAGSFDDFRADVEELVDAGDHVVVWCTLRGRVRDAERWSNCQRRTSGSSAEQRWSKSANTGLEGRPSKPWGCGSRRCCQRTPAFTIT